MRYLSVASLGLLFLVVLLSETHNAQAESDVKVDKPDPVADEHPEDPSTSQTGDISDQEGSKEEKLKDSDETKEDEEGDEKEIELPTGIADAPKTEEGGIDHNAVLKSSEAKRNKVGFLLSMVHKLSEKSALKKREPNKDLPELDNLSPEDMLKTLCPSSFGVCERWVKRSFKRKSPTIMHIAQTIRDRPDGVDPKRLFMFKMYEAGAGKVIEGGYDQAIDMGINIVAKKNPYLMVPITTIDYALATAYA